MSQYHLAKLTLAPATNPQAVREVPPGAADKAPGSTCHQVTAGAGP